MNYRAFFLSSFITLILIVAFNSVWYTIVMKDFYLENFLLNNTGRQHPIIAGIIAANVITAFAMAGIYQRCNREKHSLSKGLLLGLVLGVLMNPTMNLYIYSMSSVVTIKGIIVDSAAGLFIYSLAGMLIAFIHGEMEKGKKG